MQRKVNVYDEVDEELLLEIKRELEKVEEPLEKAKLLGYQTHAHLILEENMAKTPDKVYELLKKIWEPALKVAKKEAKELQEMIYKEGNKFKAILYRSDLLPIT